MGPALLGGDGFDGKRLAPEEMWGAGVRDGDLAGFSFAYSERGALPVLRRRPGDAAGRLGRRGAAMLGAE